jgi:ATP-dependent DNA helicase RecG
MTEADTRANSGPLPAQVMVENIQVERSSRNVRIARFLNELGFIRELNEGVSRIFSSMEQSMLAKSEYRDTNSIVRLTLKNKVSIIEKPFTSPFSSKLKNSGQRSLKFQKTS